MGLLPDKQILNWKSSSSNIFCMQSVLGVSLLLWKINEIRKEKPILSFRFRFLSEIKKNRYETKIGQSKLEYEYAGKTLLFIQVVFWKKFLNIMICNSILNRALF